MFLDDIVGPMSVEEAKATKQRLDPKCWKGYKKQGTKVKGGVRVNNCVPAEESIEENAWHDGSNDWSSEHDQWTKESAGEGMLAIGDPVEIVGDVEYKGATGEVVDMGRDGRFVVVDLYNFGKHSFHASDVSYNEYADKQDVDDFWDEPPEVREERVTEVKNLAKRVRVVAGDHAGKTGTIRQIKSGAFKGAPKTFYVDLDDGGQADNLPGKALRLVKDEQGVEEGWSDKYVAQRTGQPRTPYSVYINGKKWKDFANDDHARAVMDKVKAKFAADGRDPETVTIAPTDITEGDIEKTATGLRHRAKPNEYGGAESEPDSLRTLDKQQTNRIEKAIGVKFDREKRYQGGVKVDESYWARLQNERNSKLNKLVNELQESIDKE
jgi:hypothetical protein